MLNAQDIEQTRSIGINYYNDNDFTKSTKLLKITLFGYFSDTFGTLLFIF